MCTGFLRPTGPAWRHGTGGRAPPKMAPAPSGVAPGTTCCARRSTSAARWYERDDQGAGDLRPGLRQFAVHGRIAREPALARAGAHDEPVRTLRSSPEASRREPAERFSLPRALSTGSSSRRSTVACFTDSKSEVAAWHRDAMWSPTTHVLSAAGVPNVQRSVFVLRVFSHTCRQSERCLTLSDRDDAMVVVE